MEGDHMNLRGPPALDVMAPVWRISAVSIQSHPCFEFGFKMHTFLRSCSSVKQGVSE